MNKNKQTYNFNNKHTEIPEWYDIMLSEENKDIKFYIDVLKNYNSPFLELSCGTGRILLEAIKNGLKVDGTDSSKEMITICREKIKNYNFSSNLYLQEIENLSINKKYNTIYIPGGTFGLISDAEKAQNTLRKIYNHLNNGGSLLLDIFIPWEQILSNQSDMWRIGKSAFCDDTNEHFLVSFSDLFDLTNQIRTMNIKYETFKDNNLIDTQFDVVNMRWYSINEFSLMLEKAGFTKIEHQNIDQFAMQEYSTFFKAIKLS